MPRLTNLTVRDNPAKVNHGFLAKFIVKDRPIFDQANIAFLQILKQNDDDVFFLSLTDFELEPISGTGFKLDGNIDNHNSDVHIHYALFKKDSHISTDLGKLKTFLDSDTNNSNNTPLLIPQGTFSFYTQIFNYYEDSDDSNDIAPSSFYTIDTPGNYIIYLMAKDVKPETTLDVSNNGNLYKSSKHIVLEGLDFNETALLDKSTVFLTTSDHVLIHYESQNDLTLNESLFTIKMNVENGTVSEYQNISDFSVDAESQTITINNIDTTSLTPSEGNLNFIITYNNQAEYSNFGNVALLSTSPADIVITENTTTETTTQFTIDNLTCNTNMPQKTTVTVTDFILDTVVDSYTEASSSRIIQRSDPNENSFIEVYELNNLDENIDYKIEVELEAITDSLLPKKTVSLMIRTVDAQPKFKPHFTTAVENVTTANTITMSGLLNEEYYRDITFLAVVFDKPIVNFHTKETQIKKYLENSFPLPLSSDLRTSVTIPSGTTTFNTELTHFIKLENLDNETLNSIHTFDDIATDSPDVTTFYVYYLARDDDDREEDNSYAGPNTTRVKEKQVSFKHIDSIILTDSSISYAPDDYINIAIQTSETLDSSDDLRNTKLIIEDLNGTKHQISTTFTINGSNPMNISYLLNTESHEGNIYFETSYKDQSVKQSQKGIYNKTHGSIDIVQTIPALLHSVEFTFSNFVSNSLVLNTLSVTIDDSNGNTVISRQLATDFNVNDFTEFTESFTSLNANAEYNATFDLVPASGPSTSITKTIYTDGFNPVIDTYVVEFFSENENYYNTLSNEPFTLNDMYPVYSSADLIIGDSHVITVNGESYYMPGADASSAPLYNIDCLEVSSTVSIDSNSKYIFNSIPYDINKYIGVTVGTYTLVNVPSNHPIRFESSSGTPVSADIIEITSGTDSSSNPGFYHGTVVFTVKQSFTNVSYVCGNHGYMGGENRLKFSSYCTV